MTARKTDSICVRGQQAVPGQRQCRPCKNAYMREWRKTHPLTGLARLKSICRAYTNVLVRRGHLTRRPCQGCGIEPVQAHHPDYARPRFVIWLRLPHHRAIHRKSLTT